jgi:hypothetical protein
MGVQEIDLERGTLWERAFASRVFTHLGLLALAIAAAIIYIRYVRPATPIYVTVPGSTQIVPVPKIIRTVETVTVPGPERIVLLPSSVVIERMKWPELGKDNVLAVGEVAPYRGKTSVAAVASVSDNAMTTRLVSRQEAMPFIGWEREFHGGLWYGLAGRNKIVAEVEFLPLRIGPVYPSIKGTLGMEDGGAGNGQILVGVRF